MIVCNGRQHDFDSGGEGLYLSFSCKHMFPTSNQLHDGSCKQQQITFHRNGAHKDWETVGGIRWPLIFSQFANCYSSCMNPWQCYFSLRSLNSWSALQLSGVNHRTLLGTACSNPWHIITLLAIFSMFCFNCKKEGPVVSMNKNGSMVTVTESCRKCSPKSLVWRSQPWCLGDTQQEISC